MDMEVDKMADMVLDMVRQTLLVSVSDFLFGFVSLFVKLTSSQSSVDAIDS